MVKHADVLVVGQGLAGTMLGWAFERAGISFTIAELSPPHAVSLVAGGMVNPVTGRRMVASWRAAEVMPVAMETYRELADKLGAQIWRDLRIRRLFADDQERDLHVARQSTGSLTSFITSADNAGCWIEPAGQVNLHVLLATSAAWWRRTNRLREGSVQLLAEVDHYALVIDCRGQSTTDDGVWRSIPWEYSKGELIEIEVEGLDPGLVLNRRHWVLPLSSNRALVGATHSAGRRDANCSTEARLALEESARALLGRAFKVREQRAGVRVTLSDKLPVIGRHPDHPRIGVINALGAKGAYFAPHLAQQWVGHLHSGTSFDPAIDVTRFLRGGTRPPVAFV